MKQVFLIIFIVLTGCSHSFEKQTRCPPMAILKEFSKNIMVYENVPLRTEIDSLTPTCTKEDNQYYVDFHLRMTSFRSLQDFHDPLSFNVSFFVAVVDDKGQVISRSDHSHKIKFAEKQTTSVNIIRMNEVIPTQHNASVYIGFNLDHKQLEQAKNERFKDFFL